MGKVHGTDTNGIDTGASATVILKDAFRGLTGPVLKEQPTKWNTVGGQSVTNLQHGVRLTLPEFSTSKGIQWVCHEDSNTLRRSAQYDMIISADLLSELWIEINFSTQRIIWDGIEIPMKYKHIISDLQNATASICKNLIIGFTPFRSGRAECVPQSSGTAARSILPTPQ